MNMKSKLITKYWPHAANLKNCMNMCSIHFHHVHSLLLDGRSSLSELRSCTFLDSFWCPFWPSALGSRLVCLMQRRHWSGDVNLSNSGRYCSVYKLQDRKGYGLTKTSLISSVTYLHLGGWNFVWGVKLWILRPVWPPVGGMEGSWLGSGSWYWGKLE